MDADQFDRLTQRLTGARSRRGLLAGLVAGSLSVGAWDQITTGKKGKKGRCKHDSDCRRGKVCVRKKCVTGCRGDDPFLGSDCPFNSYCKGASDTTPGKCARGCNFTINCPRGQVCRATSQGTKCLTIDGQCEYDSDCFRYFGTPWCTGPGNTCAECRYDSHCAEGTQCSADGICF